LRNFNELTQKEKNIVLEEVVQNFKKYIETEKPLKIEGIEENVILFSIEKHQDTEGRLILKGYGEITEKTYWIYIDILDENGNYEIMDIHTFEA